MATDLSEKREAIVLGDWRAQRTTGELTGPQGSERLEPKVMDLLFLLASKPGAAFTKDDIMAALWPDVIVGDDTLARAVSRLRKALGDDPKAPRYIETLPKRGYRLIAAVSPASADDLPPAARPPAKWLPAAALAAAALAIAIAAGAVLRGPASPAVAGTELVERANDFYFQYTRADNEAANSSTAS